MTFLTGLSVLTREILKTMSIFVAPFSLLNETFCFVLHTSHSLPHRCGYSIHCLIDIPLLVDYAVWGETPEGKTRHATSEWDHGYVMCKIGLGFHCFA